jgi:hypothetical protein
MRAGAGRVCVCDTVGHATPNGVQNLIRFIVDLVNEVNPDVKVDWHGHQDRGFGVANDLGSGRGAHRVHACALGIGERVGNTPMDQLLVNLQLLGWIDGTSPTCTTTVRRSLRRRAKIPDNYPIVGRDAFRTGTVFTLRRSSRPARRYDWLADRVYSGPCGHGRAHADHRSGPDVGPSNVQCWLENHASSRARISSNRSSSAPRERPSFPTRRSWPLSARYPPPRRGEENHSRQSTVDSFSSRTCPRRLTIWPSKEGCAASLKAYRSDLSTSTLAREGEPPGVAPRRKTCRGI